MRILFTTIGGTGHFNPLIPYAREMLRRGYEVRVAAVDKMTERIKAAGLEHVVVGGPTEEEHKAVFSKVGHLPPPERGPFINAELFAGLLPRTALPAMQKLVEEWKPDLIVREAAEYAGAIVSALTGIPHVRVSVSNGHTFSMAIGPLDKLREEYGLKPDQGAFLRNARAFTSFPASIEPANGDGALLPQFRVAPSVPVIVSDAQPDWLAPGDLPRVYMTFGTAMGSSDQAKQMFRAALDAVGQSDITALMTTGPEMDVDALGEIPANVTLRAFVPQAEVFAHVDAVLCHGGSGSMLGALGAGLPLVVTPIGADQPDNARSVAEIGAGIAVSAADADTIKIALNSVIVEPSYRSIAQSVAAEMASNPSIEAAVNEMLKS
jgi:UDP:flavonoid glycosyltransferase YjiC (YdhE family)